jgi:DNA-binding NarL/FixJ family response regulator
MNIAPASNSRKKRILLVDDHPLLRSGLAKVLNQQPDFMICGEAADGPGGLAAVATCAPDVLIADLSLEQGHGLDLIKDVRARNAKLPILVLSMHHEHIYAERAARAGAQGYVMKSEPASAIIAALRKVLAGHLAFSDSVLSRFLDQPINRKTAAPTLSTDRLSDRELEIFRLLGQGLGTRQIAAKLARGTSTVETHRAAIKRKLGLASGTELVACAAQFLVDESTRKRPSPGA